MTTTNAFFRHFDRHAHGKGLKAATTHYCPGCGHGLAHKYMAEAIDELGVQDRTQAAVQAVERANVGNIVAAMPFCAAGAGSRNWGAGIDAICDAALRLAAREDVFIALPVHPNPHVREPILKALGDHPAICLLDPLGYAEFVVMLDRAHLVMTDSGGVQEEAPTLGKPALILRENTERPITVTMGTNELVTTATLADNLHKILAGDWKQGQRPPLWDGKTASRAVRALEARL